MDIIQIRIGRENYMGGRAKRQIRSSSNVIRDIRSNYDEAELGRGAIISAIGIGTKMVEAKSRVIDKNEAKRETKKL